MTKCNRTVGYERSKLRLASKPKHTILAKLSSPKNPFRHLLFEACYEAILLWRSRSKLHCVESYGRNSFLPAS